MYASSTTPADSKYGARFCVFKAFWIAVWAPEKHAGLGETPICNRRQDSNLHFPEGCSYPDSSDIGVRSGLCRYCGSQRGLLKTHAALPDFRLNDFDSIHSLMDGLLCVPLKETNPPPESDSEISKGLRPLLVCLRQAPQRI